MTFKGQFTSEFGDRIEKYIKLGLDEANIDYEGESQLKEKLKDEKNKVVDYLIEGQVMIECKGVEMHPMPRIAPNRENLSNYFKNSILKALTQQVVNISQKLELPKDQIYIIIVTYKEFKLRIWKGNSKENY